MENCFQQYRTTEFNVLEQSLHFLSKSWVVVFVPYVLHRVSFCHVKGGHVVENDMVENDIVDIDIVENDIIENDC